MHNDGTPSKSTLFTKLAVLLINQGVLCNCEPRLSKNIHFVLDKLNMRLCASAKRVHVSSIAFCAIPVVASNVTSSAKQKALTNMPFM